MLKSCSIVLLLGQMIATPSSYADPLDEWKKIHAPSGTITLTGRKHGHYYRGYLCPTYRAAVSVATSIKEAATRVKNPKRLQAVFHTSLRRTRCTPISSPALAGIYKPFEVGSFAAIDWGFEAQEDWTPLRAVNPDGLAVNLIYDASVYAIEE